MIFKGALLITVCVNIFACQSRSIASDADRSKSDADRNIHTKSLGTSDVKNDGRSGEDSRNDASTDRRVTDEEDAQRNAKSDVLVKDEDFRDHDAGGPGTNDAKNDKDLKKDLALDKSKDDRKINRRIDGVRGANNDAVDDNISRARDARLGLSDVTENDLSRDDFRNEKLRDDKRLNGRRAAVRDTKDDAEAREDKLTDHAIRRLVTSDVINDKVGELDNSRDALRGKNNNNIETRDRYSDKEGDDEDENLVDSIVDEIDQNEDDKN